QFDLVFNQKVLSEGAASLWRSLRDEHSRVTDLGFYCTDATVSQDDIQKTTRNVLDGYLRSRTLFRGFRIHESGMDEFEAVVARAHQQKIKLTVVFQPVHALMLEAIHAAGLWETFEQWQSDIITTVEQTSDGTVSVWSFLDYHPYTTQPMLTTESESTSQEECLFVEPSHCKPRLGTFVLQRLFDDDHAQRDFGRRVQSTNISRHFAMVRENRRIWQSLHAKESNALKKIAIAAGHDPLLSANDVTATAVNAGRVVR
ncbi:MAG: hypothetical protein KDA52_05895, partial [Planctomycetaceae bacterium]|nr:hypothetical protein [Planctomycetaceae bacterium]